MQLFDSSINSVKMGDSVEERIQDLEDFCEEVVKKLKEQTREIEDLRLIVSDLTELYSYPEDEFFYVKNVCIINLID